MVRDQSFKNGRRYEVKDFYVEIRGGLGWVKWLKIRLGQGFIFHAIISLLHLFW